MFAVPLRDYRRLMRLQTPPQGSYRVDWRDSLVLSPVAIALWLGLVDIPGLPFPVYGHRLKTDIVQWTGLGYGVNSVKLRKPKKNLSGVKRYGTVSRYPEIPFEAVSTNFDSDRILLLRTTRY